MSTVNLLTTKSNNEIMADSLLNVQNIELKDTNFTQRTANLGPELLFGLPVTGALVTAPYWGTPLLKPYKAFSEMRKADVSYVDAWKSLTKKAKQEKLSKSFLTESESFWQGRKNIANYNKVQSWAKSFPKYDTTKKISELTGKELANYNKSLCYKEAQKLINEIQTKKLKGQALKEQVAKILDAIREGDAKVHEMKISGGLLTSKLGTASNWVKNKTGYNALKGNILKSSRGASALRMVSKGAKGTGIFAIIGGLLEIPNLISAHQVDKAEKAQGRDSNYLGRQAVKSTVKVASNVLGYAAGSAAAGAAAGTIFPGIGNIAGAIIGFVGGCIGAMATGYVADKVVGEHTASEEYLAKLDSENKTKSKILAKEAESNSETRDQLLMTMYQKIENGEISDSDVIKAFKKELEKRNVQQEQTSQNTITLTNNDTDNEYASLIKELRGLQTPNLYYAA